MRRFGMYDPVKLGKRLETQATDQFQANVGRAERSDKNTGAPANPQWRSGRPSLDTTNHTTVARAVAVSAEERTR